MFNNLGATQTHIVDKEAIIDDEIRNYAKNKFTLVSGNINLIKNEFTDELFVLEWFKYILESNNKGVLQTLKKYFVQFNFPIKKNSSQTEYYKLATLRGKNTSKIPEATGIDLKEPQKLQLKLHSGTIGHIPVLIVPNRFDFISIIQALCYKNEPVIIPESMGAAMIKGINNWTKIQNLKDNFIINSPVENWNYHFKHNVIPNKDLYQDKIIVLSDIPYSGVPSSSLGIDENEWKGISLKIRLEHEYAHYFTLRKFGVMANNMHDELIADYAGICAGYGAFNLEWFLKCIGLEKYPNYRSGARLENYKGAPTLSDAAFEVLKEIVFKAAHNIHTFDLKIKNRLDIDVKTSVLTALCFTNILEMAKDDGSEILHSNFLNLINQNYTISKTA